LKKIFLTYLFIFLSVLSFAKAIQVDGYFIRKASKEKVVTKIFVPISDEGVIQFHLLQWSFRALDSFTAIDVRHYPADIVEYGFTYEKIDYSFYAISNIFNLDNGRSKFQDRKFVFLRVDVKGPCKLFTCYKLNSISSDLSSVLGVYNKIPVIKANDKAWFIFESYNFKSDISDYFKDYPALATKISNGEYGKKDLVKIVQEYNLWKPKK
jgi:hypothetical protein